MKTIFEQQTLSGFKFDAYYGLFALNINPSPFELVLGKTYSIYWDGETYVCEPQDMRSIIDGAVDGSLAIGDLSSIGGQGNGEPFFIGWSRFGVSILALDEKTEHEIAIYQESAEEPETPEMPDGDGFILKNYHGEDVLHEGVDRIVFNGADGGEVIFSEGDAVDNVPITLDFSNGDQTVTAPDGTLVKSAVIIKPETLIPENVKKGEIIAGIEGEYVGEGEPISVPLNMADGDMVIEPSDGKLLSSVTVEKPETLNAENIAAGVEIAGIIGTHQGGGGGGDFDTSDESLKYFLFTIDGEAKEIQLGKVLYDKIYQGSGKYDVNVPDKMGGYRTVIDTSYSNYSNGFFTNAYVTNVMIGENVRFANNSMGSLFKSCPRFNQPIAVLNGVNNIYALFNNCANFNQPFTIPKQIESAGYMFAGCNNFNQPITIQERDAESGVLSLYGMVASCPNFNQPVTFPNGSFRLDSAFKLCNKFNYPITAKNVTAVSYMVQSCPNFNQPISIQGNFPSAPYMVANCINFNSPVIVKSSVQNYSITDMFNNCGNFNQPFEIANGIGSISRLFYNCRKFNQPVTIPQTVTNMEAAFYYCSGMAQDITIYSKNVNNVKNMLYSKSNSRRINIYVPPASTTNTKIYNSSASYSIFGASVAWTRDNANNCYYNAKRNVYVYYTVGT